jgi:hypothetical protein
MAGERHSAMASRQGRGGSPGRSLTLSLRSRSGREQWKREANDQWESWQGSKVLNLQSGGTVGSIQQSGFGRGQGMKAKGTAQGRSVLLTPSWVSAPVVRYCRIKTMPHVKRKDLLIQNSGMSLFLG